MRYIRGLTGWGIALSAAACAEHGGPLDLSAVTAARIEVHPAAMTLPALGDTLRLTATARDAAGNVMASMRIAWSSSSPGVVTVDPGTGLVTAMSNGSATITATAGGAQGSVSLTVAQAITTIEVAPGTVTLTALGDIMALTARAKDANGRTVTGRTFSWSSSSTTVAYVSATGSVTAVANGSTTITARDGLVSASATVTVAQAAAQVRVLPAGIQLGSPGSTTRFFAFALDARNNPVPASSISWSTSDAAVATVRDSGTVSALSPGTAQITATCGQASGSATLQVGYQCYPDMPQPQLGLKNYEDRNGFRYYNLTVSNRTAYPAELFRTSPDLPACGLNEYASRTWVEIYADGRRVYGFCALGTPENLDGIWFAVPAGAARPSQVYIILNDRRCNRTYLSSVLTI